MHFKSWITKSINEYNKQGSFGHFDPSTMTSVIMTRYWVSTFRLVYTTSINENNQTLGCHIRPDPSTDPWTAIAMSDPQFDFNLVLILFYNRVGRSLHMYQKEVRLSEVHLDKLYLCSCTQITVLPQNSYFKCSVRHVYNINSLFFCHKNQCLFFLRMLLMSSFLAIFKFIV